MLSNTYPCESEREKYKLELIFFVLCPESGIAETRKYFVSETGSVSVPR
jgi:hypothetical protein